MKKIAIIDIPMLPENKFNPFVYNVVGNSTIESGVEVRFPINSVFPKVLKKDDELKIILLGKKVDSGNTENNIKLFKEEIEEINKTIEAHIEIVEIIEDYTEVKEIHQRTFNAVLDEVEKDAELYVDITYGPKSTPILIFALISFMEKYYNTDLKNIIYGNTEFKDLGKGYPEATNPRIFELTSLYFLNSIISFMNEDFSIDEARKTLDNLLK